VIELHVSEAAALSIIEQADYYRGTAGGDLALQWELAVDEAVHSLLQFPERGAPCRFRSSELSDLRWIFVTGFPKHMIFYRYSPQVPAILVVQILHGARNIDLLLNDGE
jgi:toxin ParE1/3/4